MALDEAGIQPSDVQYIHYHGTSTELNDRIETRAVKLAFNGHAYKLAGSSLKSLIGHPQGACGAAGIAATPARHAATGSCRPPSTSKNPIPIATWTTFPKSDAARYRARRGQLHRLRQQEFRHGVEKGVGPAASVRTDKKPAGARRKTPAGWPAKNRSAGQ